VIRWGTELEEIMHIIAPIKIQVALFVDKNSLSITGREITGNFKDYMIDAEAIYNILWDHLPNETVKQLYLMMKENANDLFIGVS
jgi:hypothetical protein